MLRRIIFNIEKLKINIEYLEIIHIFNLKEYYFSISLSKIIFL
jgi:hypothetical protein